MTTEYLTAPGSGCQLNSGRVSEVGPPRGPSRANPAFAWESTDFAPGGGAVLEAGVEAVLARPGGAMLEESVEATLATAGGAGLDEGVEDVFATAGGAALGDGVEVAFTSIRWPSWAGGTARACTLATSGATGAAGAGAGSAPRAGEANTVADAVPTRGPWCTHHQTAQPTPATRTAADAT